jgi:hypothetical protein
LKKKGSRSSFGCSQTVCTQIKAAGDYLLSVLKAEKKVVYSRFYNAEPGTDVALVHGMWPFLMSQAVGHRGELDDSDRERLLEEAPLLLEWAAWQLVDLGAVKTALKGSKLIDGEPDFRIELTERGMRFIEEGENIRLSRTGEYAVRRERGVSLDALISARGRTWPDPYAA